MLVILHNIMAHVTMIEDLFQATSTRKQDIQSPQQKHYNGLSGEAVVIMHAPGQATRAKGCHAMYGIRYDTRSEA